MTRASDKISSPSMCEFEKIKEEPLELSFKIEEINQQEM